MPRLRARLYVLFAASTLAMGGCAHTQRVGGNRILMMSLTEYRLIPQQVKATAGALTIYVHNYGRLTHNLVVSLHGQERGATKPIPPGGGGTLTLTLQPGSYLMASTILSDQSLGQYGTLTVTS